MANPSQASSTPRTAAEVLSMLREKSWRPIAVEQKREVQEISFAALSGKIGTKDVAIFCRQFYTMLNSGISIIQCLDILRQQFDNKKMRAIISDVYELVQKAPASLIPCVSTKTPSPSF